MLQVEHGIALLGIFRQLRFCWRINQSMPPFSELRVGAVVIDAADLSVGDALLRSVVISLGTLGNLDAARFAVAAEEGL